MQLIYNYDFILAAMVFLGVIICHFISDRKINIHRNRVFLVYMILGIADMALDVFSSILISMKQPELRLPVMITGTLYYLLQIVVPTCMLYYVTSSRKEKPLSFRQFARLLSVPFAAAALLVAANLKNGAVFYVDAAGGYCHGPYYFLIYLYAGFCMALIAADVLCHKACYSLRQRIVFLEVMGIAAGCMGIQAYLDSVLLTGFAIGLVIMILLFSFHNPYSYTDNLTGVYDFDFFQEFLSYAREKKRCYHLIACYVSNLRRLNGVLDPESVKNILRSTVTVLQQTAGTDLIFRIDGSQFLVLVSEDQAPVPLAQQLQAVLESRSAEHPMALRAQYVMICANRVTEAENSEDLLDYLKYMEKKAAASQTGSLLQSSSESLKEFRYQKEIRAFLSEALDQDLFELWLQPVYSLERERFVSMEALSRLRHPRLGSVSPDLFVSLAEQSGDVSRMGILQFRRLCRFVSQHRQAAEKLQSIKFNLSPAEFMTPGHVDILLCLMEEYGIDPSFFQFEITETVATVYSEDVLQTAEKLKARGIGLCLDDFGSGYANLGSVTRLPFHTVKLDKTLLHGAENNVRVRKFYQSIVHVLKEMEYELIAEGVETEEELAFVRQCGVNCVQGYYYSKPLCMEDAAALLMDVKAEAEQG